MIELDYQSEKPIYEQIINEIKRNIIKGSLKPQEQIPSIRELASTLGVNPNTVKKSYNILEKENIIKSYSTKGTFISNKIDNFLQESINSCYNNIDIEVKRLVDLGITKQEILERIGG